MAKKKTISERVVAIEDREAIMYQYLDELRKQSIELRAVTDQLRAEAQRRDEQHEEDRTWYENRFRQNEELSQALIILQGQSMQMLKELTSRTNNHEDRLKKGGI